MGWNMAQVSVIRDFVVALGFKTDKAAADKMKESLENVEVRAKLLNKAIVGMAAGVTFAVKKTATELDKLYFASKRIGASADNINAYGNAIEQMGGNAEQAIGTLESLSEKMRNSPGYEGMLNNLGVATKEANGAVRDRVEVMKDLSGVLAEMPQYQANAYANSLGIDQNTLLAMRDGKFISNMEKYQKIQKQMGMNDELTKSGNEFMTQYRDLSIMAKTGFLVVLMQAGKILIPLLKGLNTTVQFCVKLFSHLHPMVKDTLGVLLQIAVATLMLSAFVRMLKMLRIGLSVIRIFFSFKKSLGSVVKWLKIAKEWALKFGQAIKFLFRIFAMTPIGRIVTLVMALVTALGLLWDDYQTWKEGGESLIDWTAWSKEIDYVINKIKELMEWIKDLGKQALNFVVGGAEEMHQKTVDWTEEKIIEPIAGFLGQPTPMLDDKRRQEEAKNKPKMIDVTPSSNNASSSQQANKPTFAIQDVKHVVGQAQTLVVGLAQAVKTNVKEVASLANDKKPYSTAMTSFKGGTIEGFTPEQTLAFANRVMQRENKSGKTDVVNKWGYTGKYQFGASALAETGFIDPKKLDKASKGVKNGSNAKMHRAFLADKSNWLVGDWEQYKNSHEMQDLSFKRLVESNLKTGKSVHQNDVKKMMGYAMAAHLKGAGNAKKWYAKGIDSKDGNGTKTSDYAQFGEGALNYVNPVTVLPPNVKNLTNNSNVPNGNPHKGQQLSASQPSASNVTINQNYQTDMTINGAKDAQASANAVKRQQDSGNTMLARNAQSVMV